MGSKTTKFFKNTNQTNSELQNDDNGHHQEQIDNHDKQLPYETVIKHSTSPFVHYRRGSMYVDEDGDIAHEFYIETKEGSNLTLKQISNKHLTPQGNVPLDVPCLRNDYPVVLLDQSRVKE